MEFLLTDHSNATRQSVTIEADPITIGRDDTNAIALKSPFVAKTHAQIFRKGNQLMAEALCRSGTRVANREIEPGKPVRIDFGDEIQVGQFTLAPVRAQAQTRQDLTDAQLQQQLMAFEQAIHTELLERLNLRVTGSINKGDQQFVDAMLTHLDDLLRQQVPTLPGALLEHTVKSHLHRLVTAEVVRQAQGKLQTDYRAADDRLLDAQAEQMIVELVTSMVDMMPLLFDPTAVNDDLQVAEEAFPDLCKQELPSLPAELKAYVVRRTVAKDIQDVLLGLGPLTDLLQMPTVSEVMVVGKDRIYIEKNGVIQATTRSFFSDEVLLSIIERILTPVGRRIDTSTPMVDARLPDGSRVNAVIHPLSLVGPCLTIRKFGYMPFTMDDLIDRESVSDQVATFLQGCIIGRSNILIAGGTGSGKTTLLNVLSAYARPTERILTVEESAELQLPQPHVVRLEGRPANAEGRGEYAIRELVRNALRMRPDRIIVGEVRGPEALDMLQAMNTGHDGSLSTIHANSPYDAMKRLEALVLMAVDMPVRAIREQVVTAVDLIVQATRFSDGRRRITQISEVIEIDRETHEIVTQDIFTLKDGNQERLRHTGYIPTFAQDFIERGCFDVEVFL